MSPENLDKRADYFVMMPQTIVSGDKEYGRRDSISRAASARQAVCHVVYGCLGRTQSAKLLVHTLDEVYGLENLAVEIPAVESDGGKPLSFTEEAYARAGLTAYNLARRDSKQVDLQMISRVYDFLMRSRPQPQPSAD